MTRGPWIDHFGDNFLWSNATLILKGMAPYGVVALEEIDRVCERLRVRQNAPRAWQEEWRAMGVQLESRADSERQLPRRIRKSLSADGNFVSSDSEIRKAEASVLVGGRVTRNIGFGVPGGDLRIANHCTRGIDDTATDAGVVNRLLCSGRRGAHTNAGCKNHDSPPFHKSSAKNTTPPDSGHTSASERQRRAVTREEAGDPVVRDAVRTCVRRWGRRRAAELKV